MLTSLLDALSHAPYHYRFAWCSMKSIGRVSHTIYQTPLQADLCLISEIRKKGLCVSFPSQTIQGQTISLKRNRIKIWANNLPNQKNWLVLLSSQRNYHTCFSLLCWSGTHKSFLHARTPERRTRACAHLFQQCEHGQAPHTKKHILQKNVQAAETLGNDSSGGASKPHRSKYIGVCTALFFFLSRMEV
jgi:hypothetical protein